MNREINSQTHAHTGAPFKKYPTLFFPFKTNAAWPKCFGCRLPSCVCGNIFPRQFPAATPRVQTCGARSSNVSTGRTGTWFPDRNHKSHVVVCTVQHALRDFHEAFLLMLHQHFGDQFRLHSPHAPNPPLKRTALILRLFPIPEQFPGCYTTAFSRPFAEPSQSRPRFGLWVACLRVSRPPLRRSRA